MADVRTGAVNRLPEPLTDREREILACLVGGLSNKEIAARLHLALRTVKWYNSQIYSKLGVGNRQEAVKQAMEFGLLPLVPDISRPEGKHNLPILAASFVGRQHELGKIEALLNDNSTRLITILAPGGMGKTRLALEAAKTQIPRYPDGVFFVPLVDLRLPNDIVTTIAAAIGFSFHGADSPVQQLIDFLQDRVMLLVLDNFEHLLDGAPLVADIVQVAPTVRILVTSREQLNLYGETVYTLFGLHYPTWETSEDMLAYDAVQLFLQSARRIRLDFQVEAEDFEYLAHICRLTAGMPLGIELAAAWVDVLSLEQIAAEIQSSLDILQTELRNVPERHRSIRATFERTWERLTEDEQAVFRRLSVFQGGFTLPAAQIVAGANVHHFHKLAHKALILAVGKERFTIHELLRQYGAEKLHQTGEAEALQATHLSYFARFMRERGSDIKGRRQLDGLNGIEADFDNIRAAWGHAIKHADYDALDLMMECLELFCEMHAHYQVGDALFQRAVETLASGHDAIPPGFNRLRIYQIRVWRLQEHSPIPKSIQELLASSTEVARQQNDRTSVALCLLTRGDFDLISFANLDSETALAYFKQALALFRDLGNAYMVGRVLRSMSSCYFRMGRGYEEQFEAHIQELLGLTHDIGDKTGMAHALLYRSARAEQQGKLSQAARLSQDAAAIWREMGDRKSLGFTILDQAFHDMYRGEWESAHQAARQAVTIGSDTNFAWLSGFGLAILGFLAVVQGDYETGERLGHEAALYTAKVWVHDNNSQRTLCLAAFGLGDFEQARRHLRDALHLLSQQYQYAESIHWLAIAALILAHDGKRKRAVEVLGSVRSRSEELTGWLARWQLMVDLQRELEAELDSETYAAAWAFGAKQDIEALVGELYFEFADTTLE